MRAIDADALPVHKAYCVDEAGFGATFYVVDKEDIDKAPTIDAVPVVRCEYCVHGEVCLNLQGTSFVDCYFDDYATRKLDDFCSYGDRRKS